MFERDLLLQQLGDPYTNKIVERLFHFAFVPPEVLESLAREALAQVWGNNNYVLTKYLAVHIAWSIEQGHYTLGDNQFYVTAGHLQTRYGTPLYLVFAKNKNVGREPYCIVTAGSNISAPQLPIPPEIPPPRQTTSNAVADHGVSQQRGHWRKPCVAVAPCAQANCLDLPVLAQLGQEQQ